MSAAASAGPAPSMPQDDSNNDICPVCKSSRYLNPNMKLKVNTQCWHRMCESCVERIFAHGSANCPIAGCKRTLRKYRFRDQTFGDIQIEREVDIRREVNEIANLREEDFEELRDYNDFLESLETITYNLVHNIDLKEARAALDSYKAIYQKATAENSAKDQEDKEIVAELEKDEAQRSDMRWQASMREIQDKKRAREENNNDLIERLANGQGTIDEIVKDARKGSSMAAKERAAARHQEALEKAALEGKNDGEAYFFCGLDRLKKKKKTQETEKPYSPFAGVHIQRQQPPSAPYRMDWLDKARNDMLITAGGYDFNAYCRRASSDVFSGLGVFVGEV